MRETEQEAATTPSDPSGPSPWSYIITLYLPFGILMGLMTGFPVALFRLLGFSNQVAGVFTGIGLIAAFRFLYAPWLDGATTKRRLSLFTVGAAATAMLLIALILFFRPPNATFLWLMALMLVALALVSAAHETAADGFYIRALDAKLQAQFIGIKAAANRIGSLSVIMILMLGATKIAATYGATGVDSPDKTGFYIGFSVAYAVGALALLGALIWNIFHVPVIPQDQPVRHQRLAFVEVLREYFAQSGVFLIILFILLYRFGEGFLAMKGPFYLDPIEKGGLAAQATALPYYSILTDTPWMIVGGILGGYLIKWYGIRRTFIPLALFMSLPNIFYVLVAWIQPMAHVSFLGESLNVWLIVASSIESLGYGLSFSAMFYYMHIMATESGRNKTSILAISFALMNVGFLVPGMMSGFVQAGIGYVGVFIVSSAVGLLVLFIIPFRPMPRNGHPADSRGVEPAKDPVAAIAAKPII